MLSFNRLAAVPALRVAIVLAMAGTAGCGTSSLTSPNISNALIEFDLVAGTGTAATAGRVLTVDYTGWLYDSTQPDNKGAQFDTSLQAGRTPLVFTLGAGQVIPGFEQGTVGMKVGGTRRLTIPPNLAYGAAGSGTVPPNATVIFEIMLENVQ